MHGYGRLYRFVLGLLACASFGACHEESTSPRNIPTVPENLHNLGTVIVDVDMKSGTVKMHPLGASSNTPPGVSAKFYGTTQQIEYNFDGQPQGVPAPGFVDFNLHGGFSNLLTFAIGTNSPHTYPVFPQDTMGVYIYFTFLPYNFTSANNPCAPPTCTVEVDSADGAYPFTSGTPQPYHYFKTILEGGGTNAQHQGPFETRQDSIGGFNYTRPFSFRATTNVSTFSFGISVAAAWVDPNESRWKVFYVADSLPNALSFQDLRSEPDWRVLGTGGGTATIEPTNCVFGSGCQLQIVSTTASSAPETLLYYRSDSLRASQDGYIAATMSTPVTSASPSIFLGLKDPDKLVRLGISGTQVGFTDASGAFIPTFAVSTTGTETSWRVSKVGATTAAIYTPANNTSPLLTIPYASLPTAPARGANPGDYDHFFFFGNITQPGTATDATSRWTDVNYEIGVAGP